MLTPPPPALVQLYDEVFVYPVSLSVMVAALQAGQPVCFLWPSPSPEVTRRIGYYIGLWISGHLEGDWMYQTAYRWPAWDRTHSGPVAAECGWTGYVDSAAIRKITQGEAR